MSETSDVVRPTIELLNGIPGVLAERLHAGRVKVRGGWMHLGHPGAPDIVATVRGASVYFEAKQPKGLVSEEQLEWHARARRAGAQVHIIRSAKEAIDVVRELIGS